MGQEQTQKAEVITEKAAVTPKRKRTTTAATKTKGATKKKATKRKAKKVTFGQRVRNGLSYTGQSIVYATQVVRSGAANGIRYVANAIDA